MAKSSYGCIVVLGSARRRLKQGTPGDPGPRSSGKVHFSYRPALSRPYGRAPVRIRRRCGVPGRDENDDIFVFRHNKPPFFEAVS